MLSGRAGPFEWPAKSEQAEAYARLMAAAGDIHVVRVPFVAGRALQVCTDAGLDPATAMMTEFAPLAERLGVSVFHASACASELALWWQRTGGELRKVLAVNRRHRRLPPAYVTCLLTQAAVRFTLNELDRTIGDFRVGLVRGPRRGRLIPHAAPERFDLPLNEAPENWYLTASRPRPLRPLRHSGHRPCYHSG